MSEDVCNHDVVFMEYKLNVCNADLTCLVSKLCFTHIVVNPNLCGLQREKKNLQDINNVFVFSVDGEDALSRPTAKLIKEFDHIEGTCPKIFSSYKMVQCKINR